MADAKEESSSSGVPKPGGCALGSFVWGAVMIGVGVYLMNRWDALGGLTRAGAVALVVLGTLLVLPLLFVLALRIAISIFVNRAMKGLAEGAEEILAGTRAMYDKVHEFRDATPDDFEGLDRNYYEETTRALADSGGYRHLGDVVDKTIEEIGHPATPIRVLAAADGSHTVAIYHLNLSGGMDDDDDDDDEEEEDEIEDTDDDAGEAEDKRLMCDVTTEFSDGTFLMTSNTQESDLMTPPPQIEQRKFPLRTPIPELLRAHVAEHHKLLAAKGPEVRAVTVGTLADAIESERRQQAVKNAFRKGIGFVEPNEIRRIMSRVTDDPSAEDAVVDAVDKARKREGDAGSA